MPRPVKPRRIEKQPDYTYFKPRGVPTSQLDEVVLKVEELEALRLKDVVCLHQADCAEQMHVSRQTFQNIIESARSKVTGALISGKAIRIQGGNYTLCICHYTCSDCGHDFEVKVEEGLATCPKCGSQTLTCSKSQHYCKERCSKYER